MATTNAVGNSLTGSTGSGTFVGANTPTLITPVLGAATATSINFGGSTLNTFTDTTAWTPTATFVTPGDVSMAYAFQLGTYSRIGNMVLCHFLIGFTPTYTTASGNLIINGFPFTAAAGSGESYVGIVQPGSSMTWPTGCTTSMGLLAPSTKNMTVACIGTGVATGFFSTTQITTGVSRTFVGSIMYYI